MAAPLNEKRLDRPGDRQSLAPANERTIHPREEETSALMQRLNRMATVGELSTAAAHEIKNALVPVKTFIDLLLEEKPNSELAGIVRREIERINLLVAEMLKLATPARPQLMPVSLKKVLEESLRLVGHQALIRSVTIQTQFEAAPDHVLADVNQLEQVFLNLFLNALDAVNPGGRVIVATRALVNDNQIEAAILDDGSGISEQDMQHLFEPFFSTKEGGTGLGLSISRGIVVAQGGQIVVENRPEGGAAFRVRLPMAPAQAIKG